MKYILLLLVFMSCKDKPKVFRTTDGKVWIIDKKGWLHPLNNDTVITVKEPVGVTTEGQYLFLKSDNTTFIRPLTLIHDTIYIVKKEKYTAIPFKVTKHYNVNEFGRSEYTLNTVDSFFTIKKSKPVIHKKKIEKGYIFYDFGHDTAGNKSIFDTSIIAKPYIKH